MPEDTVTSPLDFLLFITDLVEGIKGKVCLFADNCILCNIIKGPEDVPKLQKRLAQTHTVAGYKLILMPRLFHMWEGQLCILSKKKHDSSPMWGMDSFVFQGGGGRKLDSFPQTPCGQGEGRLNPSRKSFPMWGRIRGD